MKIDKKQTQGFCFFLTLFLMLGIGQLQARSRVSFNTGWTFHLADSAGYKEPSFQDGSWRKLTLPHDWAIEGDFSKENPSGTGGGALPGGIGWYRKTFTLKPADKNTQVFIDFDGVYMNSEVFINGVSVGKRPYGYISFRYDLTPYIKWGEKNVLAVRVDNKEQPNSRWYSGCGIYRNVWLVQTAPIHVAHWGTFVTTPSVNSKEATFSLETTVDNTTLQGKEVEVLSVLLDEKKKEKARTSSLINVGEGASMVAKQTLKLKNPALWSVENPTLYNLKTTLLVDGRVIDDYETPVGVRHFTFDAQNGFILNGQSLKINGVCLHHDLGCLGAAFNTRAMQRELEILRAMGCNAIRCSHNPPAPEMLDLCDRMGFIVMDEAFDMWRKRKTTYDYSRFFGDWHERDLTDLILRDRNHPSIFMWSIGNEVLEQWTDVHADTLSLEEANLILNFGHEASLLAKEGETMSVNSMLCKKLADCVRKLDSTRPVTAANNEPDPGNHLFRSGALDLIGFNYHDDWFAGVPQKFPGKPFIITESISGLMTRGYYRMPSDSTFLWPARWDKAFYDPSFSCSSYDNCHAPWGNSHEGTMRHVKNNKFISGQFVWTGFDYIGEPTPYGWPARSSYFGIVDLAGFPKDVYYLYQSEWTSKPMLHLFPHWNWMEGQTIDLWAYYNQADEVELFINGRSCGVKQKGPDDFHVMWRVRYESGTIKAVSRKNGKTVCEEVIHTAGKPAQIRLTPDRNILAADGKDLSFVTVEVLDADGNLCPNAENQIHFEITGDAFIAGVDNGSPISMERFKASQRNAFYGKCLVVLQSTGIAGSATLVATSSELKQTKITIKLKNNR